MEKRLWIHFGIVCMVFLLLTACGGGSSADSSSDTDTVSEETTDEDTDSSDESEDDDSNTSDDSEDDDSDTSDDSGDGDTDSSDDGDDDDGDTSDDSGDDDTETTDAAATITMIGDSIIIDGSGATADGSVITISSAGTYWLTGDLNDGMVKVDTEDEETVTLVLDGVDIACSYQSPLQVLSAEKTVIVLADGSENLIADSENYTFDDPDEDEPNAAVYSKDDLVLNGDGNLTVVASYNDGIAGKDGLIIDCGGTVTIDAVDDGIRGKDYLTIENGTFMITADGDGLKSDNDEDDGAGTISIAGGTLDITAGGDAIQAASDVLIEGGIFSLSTGGGSSHTVDDSNSSAKGIKASASVVITSGNFTISSADDCIHANGTIDIVNGTFLLSSGDDGIHADTEIEIDDADMQITQSYEGIESARITINGGNFIIVASDDGLNVAGGNDGSSIGGRPGQGNFDSSDGDALYINGGYFAITSAGDGMDINGSIEMTGGTVLIHGPTSSADGAIDYDRSFTISGGFLAAAGSSGMAMGPSGGSSQSYARLTFSTRQADTLVHIESTSGESLLTFAPSTAYQSLVFSSTDLNAGQTYNLYFGGVSTGVEDNGLYTGGTYSGGTLSGSFTAR